MAQRTYERGLVACWLAVGLIACGSVAAKGGDGGAGGDGSAGGDGGVIGDGHAIDGPPAQTLPPSITSVTPAHALLGATVTVSGAHLGGATVTIGGVTATLSRDTDGALDVVVPATALDGPGQLVVTTTVAPAAMVAFTVELPADVSLDDGVIPDPSKLPNIVPPVRPGKINGAGIFSNAYMVETDSCAASNAQLGAGAAVTRRYQHNISYDAYKINSPVDRISMGPGEALSYAFVAGAEGTFGMITYNVGNDFPISATVMTLSRRPCDFDLTKLSDVSGTRDPCYSYPQPFPTVYYTVTSGVPALSTCGLKPGVRYYLNLRFLDGSAGGDHTADACTYAPNATGICGGILQVH
jgi:hypothetical protein